MSNKTCPLMSRDEHPVICNEDGCMFWIVETPHSSGCLYIKSLQKQSGLLKVMDYIHMAIRDIQQIIRHRM